MAKEQREPQGSDPRLATVTSLVGRRIERQRALGQFGEAPGGQLRNELTPHSDSSSADAQGSRELGLAPEMSNGSLFVHADKLNMLSVETQPCLVSASLSLLCMSSQAWKRCETLAERLQWSIEHAKISQADLAAHLKISTAAMSEWFTGKVKNPKLRNIFLAAQFCKVHSWWLAIGEGTPFDGINPKFEGISGQDLLIAKELSELDDRSLRETVGELIAARRAAIGEQVQKKRKT